MQNSDLMFYQVHSFDRGPEISRSITVKEDFSWSVYYRRQLVSPEHCIILKKAPPTMKSGNFLIGHTVHIYKYSYTFVQWQNYNN